MQTSGPYLQQKPMQPTQYASGPHSTGRFGPPNTMNLQMEHAQRFNGEMMRQNRGGTLMSPLVPPSYSASPASSGRNSPCPPTRQPQGSCTPMDDVESREWAQMPGDPHEYQPAHPHMLGCNMVAGFGPAFPTPLAKPQPKRQRKRANGLHIHGERVMVAADATRLWHRLDEDIPIGPRNPDEGITADAIGIAKRGMGHARIAMERGPTPSQPNWRPVTRSNQRRGGHEEDLYHEYMCAVRNYIIALPSSKIIYARENVSRPIFTPGNRIAPVREVRELRWLISHWAYGNRFRKYRDAPADAILQDSKSTGTWMRCDKDQIWIDQWIIVRLMRSMVGREAMWKSPPNDH